MHVYVSVDLEGVAGIASPDELEPTGIGYPRAQELMTGEANAAIAGAFAGGADRVTVADSHSGMHNLIAEQLDRRARLLFGKPRVHGMTSGVDAGVDTALFVGYHAAARQRGVLAHSYSTVFTDVRLNGTPVTEAEANGLYCAGFGVGVALVAGDDAVCAVAQGRLPGVRTVAVKKAVGWSAADSLHPAAAREAIERVASEAVADPPGPVPIPDELALDVQLRSPTATELCALVPATEVVDAYTVRREIADPGELLRVISLWYRLAASA